MEDNFKILQISYILSYLAPSILVSTVIFANGSYCQRWFSVFSIFYRSLLELYCKKKQSLLPNLLIVQLFYCYGITYLFYSVNNSVFLIVKIVLDLASGRFFRLVSIFRHARIIFWKCSSLFSGTSKLYKHILLWHQHFFQKVLVYFIGRMIFRAPTNFWAWLLLQVCHCSRMSQ